MPRQTAGQLRLRAAIYARVSTRDQDTANQISELREYAAATGYELSAEFVEIESGAKADRPQLRAMLEAARRRRFDVLLFWSLDRLTREGATKTLQLLDRLTSYGIRYRSHTEEYLDSCGIFRDAVIAILGAIAKQERTRISERTKAGMERAKAQGKEAGRPRRIINRDQIEKGRTKGHSWARLARELGASESTLRRRYRQIER